MRNSVVFQDQTPLGNSGTGKKRVVRDGVTKIVPRDENFEEQTQPRISRPLQDNRSRISLREQPHTVGNKLVSTALLSLQARDERPPADQLFPLSTPQSGKKGDLEKQYEYFAFQKYQVPPER